MNKSQFEQFLVLDNLFQNCITHLYMFGVTLIDTQINNYNKHMISTIIMDLNVLYLSSSKKLGWQGSNIFKCIQGGMRETIIDLV